MSGVADRISDSAASVCWFNLRVTPDAVIDDHTSVPVGSHSFGQNATSPQNRR